jgi:predicted transcriptional regulator
MQVSEQCRHILVTTIPEETLLGAATRMDWYQVGALPVYRRHRLVGIVSERDVIAALARGADLATARVAEYMTAKPATARPDEDLESAAQRMTELGVRHLPVIDGDRLLGVLSARNLLVPKAQSSVPGRADSGKGPVGAGSSVGSPPPRAWRRWAEQGR